MHLSSWACDDAWCPSHTHCRQPVAQHCQLIQPLAQCQGGVVQAGHQLRHHPVKGLLVACEWGTAHMQSCVDECTSATAQNN
jgi:hypothetical protein